MDAKTRRTRLSWFLFGVAVTSLSVVVSWSFANRPSKRLPVILITEPADDFSKISAGEMLRDCGLNDLTVSGVIPDGRQIVSFSLTEDSSLAFACISQRIQQDRLEWTLAFGEPEKLALETSGFSH